MTNIYETEWQEETTPRGENWKHKDLSGQRLGVRVEALAPGENSSVHHYHTSEEEHFLVLTGEATLRLGEDAIPLKAGDHHWFAAGVEIPHHIENTSGESFEYLVFGERNQHDVVVYPEHQVMMVKGLDFKQVTYRDRAPVKDES